MWAVIEFFVIRILDGENRCSMRRNDKVIYFEFIFKLYTYATEPDGVWCSIVYSLNTIQWQ